MKEKYEVFRTFIEFIMVPIVSLAVYILRDMNSSMQDLNTKVSVIMAERNIDKEVITEIKQRVFILEQKRK